MEEKKRRTGRPIGRVNKKYSATFKQEVVETRIKEKLGFKEASRRFLPHLAPAIGCTMIQKWERIYLQEGAEGLAIERRGRKGGRSPMEPLKPEVENDLIARIQYLEMENEYLKKLKALVLKRERQEQKKRK